MKKSTKTLLLVLCGLVALAGAALIILPLRETIVWHANDLRTRLFYKLNPPEDTVFQPEDDVNSAVTATFMAMTAAVPTQTATPPVVPATPTVTPTPLPDSISLKGTRYMDQHGIMNYCAPSNLAMALSFWAWGGTRLDPGKYLKPLDQDKNVMPYEMIDYVNTQTELRAINREGGTLQLAKALIAGGFPVLIEKGTYIVDTTGTLSWMGHYNLLTGYDDVAGNFIVQDSYFEPDYLIPYATIQNEWRAFNYTFIIVYPLNYEERLFSILGDYADEQKSYEIALQIASTETAALQPVDRLFAYFNRGTSSVKLQDYGGAVTAYNEAFRINEELAQAKEPKRPWRISWYQTGPYFAYFFTGQYQNVIDLANTTLSQMAEPNLEESYYWRAMAKNALGDTQGALEDLQTSLKHHPGFTPSEQLLQEMGYPG